MRQDHALRLAGGAARVDEAERCRSRVEVGGARRSHPPLCHQVLELEDPVVVPEIRGPHRRQKGEIGKVGEELVELFEQLFAVPLLRHHRRADFAVAEEVAEFVEGGAGIERHHDGPEAGGGEERHHPLRPVGEDQRELVPLLDPPLRQRLGEGRRPVPDLPPGPTPLAGHEEFAVGMSRSAPIEQPGEVRVGQGVLGSHRRG